MKVSSLGLALLCAATSATVAAEPATPTIYGQLSGRVAHFSDTNFLGDSVDTTAYLSKAILGARGLYLLSDSVKLAYRLEADFAPLAEADGTQSIYYGALNRLKGDDDDIFIRYAGAAFITDYGLFAFGDAMSGVYEEFYSAVDLFEVNTQDSTPSAVPNGARMWTQTKWSKDGLVYKTPVWNNFYAKFVLASIDNGSATDDDLKIVHGVYKTDNFMLGLNLSVYDKELVGVSSGESDRERWVLASHYNWDQFRLAAVYEMNRDLGATGADFDVFGVTGTYIQDKLAYSLSYQEREEATSGALMEDRAVLAQVRYTHDQHLDFWAEVGAYDESDNDNLAVGLNIRF
ncbi:porin [Marinobacterium rhizophilum]|uniref:Porin n=1 Tax=Marinobacterium rhizophilum TaxID=420402 RepID=A0ABY5HFV3_9GAMM|nr:porin [Marinobacterium rhizophilum]UTW10145.1 porin [Marinobacterium rhizophilum]